MTAGLLLVLILSAPEGTAQEKAKVAYSEGVSAFKAKEYKVAFEKFEYAYMLDPSPNLLFSLGRISEEMGNFGKAIHYFQLYLDRHPDAQDAAEVRGKIEGIRAVQKYQAQQNTKEPDPPVVTPPTSAPASQPVTSPASAPTSQPASPGMRPMQLGGWIAVGLAGAFAIGGVAMDLNTLSLVDDAEKLADTPGTTQAELDDAKAEAISGQTLTLVLYGAAVVSGVTGGTLLYLDHKSQQSVSVAPTPGGLLLFGTF